MKKIALISNKGFGSDGISAFIMNNYRLFKHTDVRYSLGVTRVIGNPSIEKQLENEFKAQGDEAISIPKFNGKINYIKQFYSYVKRGKFDIVHLHASNASVLLELMICKAAGIKNIIVHCHNTTCDHVYIHKLLRPMVNWLSDVKLACGVEAGKWMFAKQSFTVIPNCIQLTKYQFNAEVRAQKRMELGVKKDEILLGHIGGFNHQKNQAFLVAVMKELIKTMPFAKMALVGQGFFLDAIQHKINELNLQKHFLLLKQRTDVNELMMAMDIFLLPSNYEGFPIVGVEAQASGLPTFFSDRITDEVSLTNLTKYLSIDHGVDGWIKAIQTCELHTELRSKYRQILADKGYDISQSARMLEKQYQQICNK